MEEIEADDDVNMGSTTEDTPPLRCIFAALVVTDDEGSSGESIW